ACGKLGEAAAKDLNVLRHDRPRLRGPTVAAGIDQLPVHDQSDLGGFRAQYGFYAVVEHQQNGLAHDGEQRIAGEPDDLAMKIDVAVAHAVVGAVLVLGLGDLALQHGEVGLAAVLREPRGRVGLDHQPDL